MNRLRTTDTFELDDGRVIEITVMPELDGTYIWRASNWPVNIIQVGHAHDREEARMAGRRWLEAYNKDRTAHGAT